MGGFIKSIGRGIGKAWKNNRINHYLALARGYVDILKGHHNISYNPEATYNLCSDCVDKVLNKDKFNIEARYIKKWLVENRDNILHSPKGNPAKYVDSNGYERNTFKHSNLTHRQVAYRELYLKHKDKYPLPFSKYQVHHKDKNKLNNHPDNLDLFTQEEHEAIHNRR